MRRRPPRSTQSRSSAASDVYKRQVQRVLEEELHTHDLHAAGGGSGAAAHEHEEQQDELGRRYPAFVVDQRQTGARPGGHDHEGGIVEGTGERGVAGRPEQGADEERGDRQRAAEEAPLGVAPQLAGLAGDDRPVQRETGGADPHEDDVHPQEVGAVADLGAGARDREPVSYTHLRAHETVLDLVCRLLLEKKKKTSHT